MTYQEGFVLTMVPEYGNNPMTWDEALELAKQRDQERAEEFLANLPVKRGK